MLFFSWLDVASFRERHDSNTLQIDAVLLFWVFEFHNRGEN